MWWFFVVMGLLMLYPKLDDIIDAFKSSDPGYQKKKQLEEREQLAQQLDLARRLEGLQGQVCQLESSQFYLMSLPTKVQATIQLVDQGWVEFTVDKKKSDTYIVKVEAISMVARMLSETA